MTHPNAFSLNTDTTTLTARIARAPIADGAGCPQKKRAFRLTLVSPREASPVPAPETPAPYTPLKYQRLLRGWSQQDLADELYRRCTDDGKPDVAIGVEIISRWERGKSKPSPLYRKHLCQLFGLNADQFGWL